MIYTKLNDSKKKKVWKFAIEIFILDQPEPEPEPERKETDLSNKIMWY